MAGTALASYVATSEKTVCIKLLNFKNHKYNFICVLTNTSKSEPLQIRERMYKQRKKFGDNQRKEKRIQA